MNNEPQTSISEPEWFSKMLSCLCIDNALKSMQQDSVRLCNRIIFAWNDLWMKEQLFSLKNIRDLSRHQLLFYSRESCRVHYSSCLDHCREGHGLWMYFNSLHSRWLHIQYWRYRWSGKNPLDDSRGRRWRRRRLYLFRLYHLWYQRDVWKKRRTGE